MTSERTRVPAARRVTAVTAVVLLGAVTLGGCGTDPVDPERAGTVVVTTDLPFVSLNGALPAGRAPGSVLVRSLVQSGFTTLAPDGSVTPDPSFGTVEMVTDDPLTVRYTVAPTAVWSDGVPVTPADLLLEWAARSGQLDEVVPELGDDGEPVEPADDVVVFGAASAALVRASAVPVVEGATLTVVYDAPVADWQVALDVNLPAHVVGRLALDPAATPSSSPSAEPSDGASEGSPAGTASPDPAPVPTSSPTGAQEDAGTEEDDAAEDDAASDDAAAEDTAWAQAVATAVQEQDRTALAAISRVWRAAGRAGDVGADPVLTTTTGPYVLARVDADGVEVTRNAAYEGTAPAVFDRLRVRTDLDPLAQVEALSTDEVDVIAPVSTPDVLAAAEALEDVSLRTGGDAVLQVVLQQAGGGVFDPASYASAEDPAAAAADARRSFLASVPRAEVVAAAVHPLWARAEPSDVVAAQVGGAAPGVRPEDAGTDEPSEGDGSAQDTTAEGATSAGPQEPPTVRVLTNRSDPVRSAAFDLVEQAAAEAGFRVVPVAADDPARALRTRPEDWDAALVPVAQEDLPVAGFVARWRSGGATNIGGHADPALDAVLDALAAQPDEQAATEAVEAASRALLESGAVLPVVRTPVLTVAAVRAPEDARGLPVVSGVGPMTPAAADLTWWWDWTRR